MKELALAVIAALLLALLLEVGLIAPRAMRVRLRASVSPGRRWRCADQQDELTFEKIVMQR